MSSTTAGPANTAIDEDPIHILIVAFKADVGQDRDDVLSTKLHAFCQTQVGMI